MGNTNTSSKWNYTLCLNKEIFIKFLMNLVTAAILHKLFNVAFWSFLLFFSPSGAKNSMYEIEK